MCFRDVSFCADSVVSTLIRRLPQDTTFTLFFSAKSFPVVKPEFGPYLAFYLLRRVRSL